MWHPLSQNRPASEVDFGILSVVQGQNLLGATLTSGIRCHGDPPILIHGSTGITHGTGSDCILTCSIPLFFYFVYFVYFVLTILHSLYIILSTRIISLI
jgi:hypothetical protein